MYYYDLVFMMIASRHARVNLPILNSLHRLTLMKFDCERYNTQSNFNSKKKLNLNLIHE